MTKAERLTLTTMTAEAWRNLHVEELNNAHSATDWATYEELNSNKYMHGLRSEWASLSELCDALHIDMNDDTKLDPSVVSIMQDCSELLSKAFRIYKEFPDYPFRNTDATTTDATNQNEEMEV